MNIIARTRGEELDEHVSISLVHLLGEGGSHHGFHSGFGAGCRYGLRFDKGSDLAGQEIIGKLQNAPVQ